MKIAILFSGRIFKFGNHYNNIMENIVQDHDADIFLSHSPELDEDLDAFCDLYNPVALINDPIPEYDFTMYPLHIYSNTNRRNCFSMYYNRLRVFNLLDDHIKKTGIQYDCILSYRLDLFSYNKIDYNIQPNTLYIPQGSDWCNGINDQVAYGNYEPMKAYMSVFNNIYNILNSGCPFHPELINSENILLNNISIERVPFNYDIIRGNNSKIICTMECLLP